MSRSDVSVAEEAGTHDISSGSVSGRRGVRVQLEDQPRRGMAESVLRGAQIHAGRDPRSRGRVAQPVERHSIETGAPYGRRHDAGAKQRVAEWPSPRCRKLPCVGLGGSESAPAQMFGQLARLATPRAFVCRPRVFGFPTGRRAPRSLHSHSAVKEIEVAHLKAGAFTPTESELSRDEHHRPVLVADGFGEAVHLLGLDDPARGRSRPRPLDATAWGSQQEVCVDGSVRINRSTAAKLSDPSRPRFGGT